MLHQFYTEVRSLLDDRGATEARRLSEQREAYLAFLESLPADISHFEAEKHISYMPSSYVTKQTPETLHHHIRLLRDYNGEHPVVGIRESQDNRIEVVTVQASRIGNFMRIARALSSLRLSIMEARILVRDDGIAINTITVVHADGKYPEEDIRKKITDRTILSLEDKWEDSWNPRPRKTPAERGRFRFQPSVEIFNRAVPRYTVIEVRCADAVGVLVKITSVLAKYGLDIGFARIHTEGQRVIDTFYVLDSNRRKFEEAQKINWLKHSMIKALSEEE
jgi:[protein-PII] uridylyltransferase